MISTTTTLPKHIRRTQYKPEGNHYFINVNVRVSKHLIDNQEINRELQDKKHLNVIDKARQEYKTGKVVKKLKIQMD